MKSYECIFIFPPEATPEVRKQQLKNVEDLIRKFQGSVQVKTEWGRKSLAYSVKKFREGYFVLIDFQMAPAQIIEFRNTLQLQEELLKFMLVSKDVKAGVTSQSEKSQTPNARPAYHAGSVQS